MAAAMAMGGCSPAGVPAPGTLQQRICDVVSQAPGTVGVAYVGGGDTVLVNNGVKYAMMSVFKLHEALAVGDALERLGATADSVLHISAAELDPDTWSPMLAEHGPGDFDMTVGRLMEYAVTSSDNNASNILFSRIVSPEETDRFVRTVAPDTTFAILYSEAEMKRDHDLSYRNYSSPLSAALLIRQVFTTELLRPDYQEAVRRALSTVTTGHDRLGAPFAAAGGGVLFAHKTGSGYRNGRGELVAFNDVAYVRLPDGRDYSLAVMIRDFDGSEQAAASIMARISTIVYDHVRQADAAK